MKLICPGSNLKGRFIYWLFLAQDANFRLSNHNVSSEVADPIWGDGFGFFCKREGPEGYKAHIAKHVDEEEVSNCSGFQAMFMANTKRTKGLRTTGVGGVTCSRHNMWRGNGIGDLQVGERYTFRKIMCEWANTTTDIVIWISFCFRCCLPSGCCVWWSHMTSRASMP